ncbi:MAG: TIGR03936 family radical SAM-associated protein, partial [Thermodesulfobacteriota bacterium]
DSGVTRDFLIQEYERAKNGEVSKDCRTEECEGCGVCDFDSIKNVTFKSPEISAAYRMEKRKDKILPRPLRLRLRFSKTGDMRFLSHLETVSAFVRALKRAEIPLRFSEGFHPLPKISFNQPTPVGMESLDEYVDIELKSFLSPENLVARLKEVLPEGIAPIKAEIIPLNTPSLSLAIKGEHYVVYPPSKNGADSNGTGKEVLQVDKALSLSVDRFMKETEISFIRDTKRGQKVVNLRPFVKALSLKDKGEICMTLERIGGKAAKPIEVTQELLGLSARDNISLRTIKVETIFNRYSG